MPDDDRRDRSRPAAFDRVTATLRQHWHDDALGFSGDRWEDQPTLSKLAYLADFAVAIDVSFERFTEGARRVVGLEPGQQFTPEHEWFIAHEFQLQESPYASHRAMGEMRVRLNKTSLAELKAEAEKERPSRQQFQGKQLEK